MFLSIFFNLLSYLRAKRQQALLWKSLRLCKYVSLLGSKASQHRATQAVHVSRGGIKLAKATGSGWDEARSLSQWYWWLGGLSILPRAQLVATASAPHCWKSLRAAGPQGSCKLCLEFAVFWTKCQGPTGVNSDMGGSFPVTHRCHFSYAAAASFPWNSYRCCIICNWICLSERGRGIWRHLGLKYSQPVWPQTRSVGWHICS